MTGLARVASCAQAIVRRPVALALSDDERQLFVANRDSGSVCVIDTKSLQVTDELKVGTHLSDITRVGHLFFVLDEIESKVVAFKADDAIQIDQSFDVTSYPTRLVFDAKRDRLCVTSLWSREVSIFSLSRETRHAKLAGSIQLPFEPRELVLTADSEHLIVAGAFDASLAIVDMDSLNLNSVTRIPGHNIGGLAISADGFQLFVAQQQINPLAHTTRDDVHWGNLISNQLATYDIHTLCARERPDDVKPQVTQLGAPGAGAGDPGQIIVHGAEDVAVLFSGVNELALGHTFDTLRRIPVGARPMAAIRSTNGTTFVANMMSDSISVVRSDADRHQEILLGPPVSQTIVQVGEAAFFDARLSPRWMDELSQLSHRRTYQQSTSRTIKVTEALAIRSESYHSTALPKLIRGHGTAASTR